MQPTRMTAKPKQSNRFRKQRLAAAATKLGVASAAGVAGVAGESSALIMHTPPGDPNLATLSIDSTIYSSFDIISDAGMGGSLSLDDVDVGMMAPTSTIEFAFFQDGGVGPRFLQEMSFETETIDGSAAYQWRDEAFLIRNGTPHTTWAVGETAYVGFRFDAGGTTTNYGWIRLTYDTATTLTIDEWAYETDANTPIVIGHIPEPATALLMGLGLAMLGIAGQRAKATQPPEARG